MDLPPDVQAQRDVEDRAIKLGAERAELQERDAALINEALELMEDAERDGVSIERLAALIQVSRPTLYRWRRAAEVLRAARAEERGDIGRAQRVRAR
jgi:transcriptional regulator GlxA family with amidase domain